MSSPVEGLASYNLSCSEQGSWLFTENETNRQRLSGEPNAAAYVKDAFDRFVVQGEEQAVNPAQAGTRAGNYRP